VTVIVVTGIQAAGKSTVWARADRIRTELGRLSVQVTETPDGPVWKLR
jgi:cysteinyl-tRNA synthetase